MALSDAIWASGATTTGTTWASLANAYGPNDGTTATWTSSARSGAGAITFTFPSLVTNIPANAIINSVTANVFNFASNPTNRFTSVVGAFMSGSTVLHSQTYVVSDVNVEEVHTWTGITRAQLSDLTYRVTATRGNVSQSTTFYLDAASVEVDYTEQEQPPLNLAQSDSASILLTEQSTLLIDASLSDADSATVSLTEQTALTKQFDVADSLTLSADDSSSVLKPPDPKAAYPGNFVPQETWPSYGATVEAVTKNVADSVTYTLLETSSMDKSMDVSDTSNLIVSEAGSIDVYVSAVDAATASIAEESTTTGIAYKDVSDGAVITIDGLLDAEKSSGASPEHSIIFSVSEQVDLSSTSGSSDTAIVSTTESSHVFKTLESADSATASIEGTSETTSVRFIAVEDSATVSLSETLSVDRLLAIDAVDSVTPSITGIVGVMKSMLLSDSATVSINGAAETNKGWSIVDSATVSVLGTATVTMRDAPKTRVKVKKAGVYQQAETKVFINGSWQSAPQKLYYNEAWRN